MRYTGPFLYFVDDHPRGEVYTYRCPGCQMLHVLATGKGDRPRWTFDGNFQVPTFSPSVLVTWETPNGRRCCHHFIREGKIQFLGDCTHNLANQTVPMIPYHNTVTKP